ncbi:hypothetical protein Tco_0296520 [Tanacetum coccineum]
METQVPTTEEEGFGIRLDTEHSDCISFSDTTTNDETETDESDGDDDEANEVNTTELSVPDQRGTLTILIEITLGNPGLTSLSSRKIGDQETIASSSALKEITCVPNQMETIVRSRTESSVRHYLNTEPINLTTRQSSSTNNLTLVEMKEKLLNMMTKQSQCLQDELDLNVYNALLDALACYERLAKAGKDTWKKDSLKKRSHDDYDHDNHKGEKKKKQKRVGESSSRKGI